MSMIYLDNNATTQPDPAVLEAMDVMQRDGWANPSSVHRAGQHVRQRVELARQQVAQLVACRPGELIFCSGATEANNLALRGYLLSAGPQKRALITTATEHSAIGQPAQWLERQGVTCLHAPLSDQGLVDLDRLGELLESAIGDHARVLVSIQWANNETGIIQPIARIGAMIMALRQSQAVRQSRHRLVFHSDATQAVGKLPVSVADAAVDLLSFSGHKFHGPKGSGALYCRTGIRLDPLLIGGPQERDRRGGTENAPAIVGLGVAAEQVAAFLADPERIAELTCWRDAFERDVLAGQRRAQVNGRHPEAPRLWNTSNIAFAQLEAEAILLGLSERGLCASAGAACSSGSLEPSPVLLAMGIPETLAHGSVRFSLSRMTRPGDCPQAVAIITEVVSRLERVLPTG